VRVVDDELEGRGYLRPAMREFAEDLVEGHRLLRDRLCHKPVPLMVNVKGWNLNRTLWISTRWELLLLDEGQKRR
jgi:hypothetical protein